MNQVDLAFTPALELAQLIRDRKISPLELVKLYLERIQKFDSQLGSYFTVAAETALADAKAKTEQLAQTKDISQLPPFFGVPTAIKDLNAVAGMPCSYGVAALKDKIADYDDGVVTRMKMAGFTILGKTATSEVGSFPYTEPLGFPPTRNPWNLDYTSGGSSGGAAAAVAAGLCPIAQGSDGGGSIRIPAACCGLVGIKPTRGRVSHAPVGDYQSGISVNGPLARTVADAALLLDVMSGYITGDPYWLPDPETSFLEATRQKPTQLRIAFSTSVQPLGEAAEICQQGVKETVQRLEEMGYIVEPGCPDFNNLIEPFKKIWQAGTPATGIPLEAMSPLSRWIGEQAGSAGEYLQAVHQMQVISRQIVAFFETFDVLVLPVYMHQPIRIGEWADLSPEETVEKIVYWVAPSPPFNASGLPAIALPTGFDSNGLPVGIQLVGRPAGEATLISLAALLEVVKPWSHHRPPFGDS
ncbi:MAG: amidase [Xenococcaceae cyanobacterium]